MSTPLVSVVIPNYNYGRYISEAIESVLAQTYPRIEIVVVDDGSTDNSKSEILKYGDRVRLLTQQNKGVSAARNRGISESKGEYIAFLDADDKWHPEKISRQVEEMISDPKVGIVYCGLKYIDSTGQVLGATLSGSSGYILRELALFEQGIQLSSSLVRRECFEKVGLFDESMLVSEDWDITRRIACHYEVRFIKEPLAYYRIHGSGIHHNVELMEHNMLIAFSKMFADPNAKEVHHLRRRCYGNLYLMLSGSFLHAGQWGKSMKYAVKSVITWPPSISYISRFPVRQIKRLVSGRRLIGLEFDEEK